MIEPAQALDPATGPAPCHTPRLARGAVVAIAVLTLINLANYVDRYVITTLLPAMKRELGMSHAEAGLLGTAFIAVYAVASPLFGWGGDRGVRTRWVAAGIALWSLATGLAGFARGFATLFAARAAVGVGEAAYGTIAPSLIADFVPRSRRGAAMAVFSLAIPVGAALGYAAGGLLGARLGWRAAFFVVGFPGLLLAVAAALMREPLRGRFDDPADRAPLPMREVYRELLRSRVYVFTVLGYAAYTFAIGALSYWAPTYLAEVRGIPEARGGLLLGGITVATGIVGTLAGGALGDRLQERYRGGYALLSIVAMAGGATLAIASLLARDVGSCLALLTLSELFLFANTGPINALIVNSVRPAARATASAVSIFCIHVFGDVVSPPLVGHVADRAGMATAMLVIPAVFLLAGVLWLGTYEAPRARASR